VSFVAESTAEGTASGQLAMIIPAELIIYKPAVNRHKYVDASVEFLPVRPDMLIGLDGKERPKKVRFGSVAAIQTNSSRMAAIGGKAVIGNPGFGAPGLSVSFHQ